MSKHSTFTLSFVSNCYITGEALQRRYYSRMGYILNRKRNACFNYCVFCIPWVLNNDRNDMKANNDHGKHMSKQMHNRQ